MNKKILITSAIVVAGVAGIFALSNLPDENKSGDSASTTVVEVAKTDEEKGATKVEPQAGKIMILEHGNIVTIKIGRYFIDVELLSDEAFRINYRKDGVNSEDTEVTGRTYWSKVDYDLTKGENETFIKTETYSLRFDHIAQTCEVFDKSGEKILTQQEVELHNEDRVAFEYYGDQNFYGINGFSANENSKELMLRNKGGIVEAGMQGDCGAPLIWTNSGYGILIDTDGGRFDVKLNKIRFNGNSKTDLEYYVILGEPKDIMEGVFNVSGTAPMFPKWAMGFTNSEWGLDQEELVSIIDEYRKRDLPIDNFTLDFDWKAWGEDDYGEFRWNNEKFPDGASGKLRDDLLDKGLKLTGILKPRLIVEDTVQGNYAKQNGYFINNQRPYNEYFSGKLANDIDFSNAVAGAWFFHHLKEGIDSGIQGYWNDEADEARDNMQHLLMQKALYLGQRGYNDKRVWSISRNYYLGAQKYAYAMWSGDINSGFTAMKEQRERLLSAVNVGMAKWGMDTGGFNGLDPTSQNYARWIQFSAFTPIFRVHGSLDKQRQPWVFGEKAEAASKDAMQLRYKLLPYVYSYERQAYETGMGLVKPLIFDYPNDTNVANYVDAWMFGDHLLVAPIVDEDQEHKEIYLPEGQWTDYFTGEVYEGGKTITYECDAENWSDIPLFVKSGAIIPTQQYVDYVGQEKVETIELDIFPGKEKSQFAFYDDNGESYEYEDGKYYRQNINVVQADVVKLNFEEVTGTYETEVKTFDIKVHGAIAESVFVNGESVKFDMGKDVYGDYVQLSIETGMAYEVLIK